MDSSEHELALFRRTHIGRALARARWTFEAQFKERIQRRGFEDFRLSDVDIIARLPVRSGARMTELADRIGITKQGVGKLVRGLEERGYVTRSPDPEDGRAQRVMLSKRGRAFLKAATKVVAAIEEEWAEVLSEKGLERLRGALLRASDSMGEAEYL